MRFFFFFYFSEFWKNLCNFLNRIQNCTITNEHVNCNNINNEYNASNDIDKNQPLREQMELRGLISLKLTHSGDIINIAIWIAI